MWMRTSRFEPPRKDAHPRGDTGPLTLEPRLQVGVLTMAGKTPTVLVTPTQDLGKVLNSMHDLPLEGDTNLASAVQIAQLALKHRQNKNQRQRIVLFVGSPVTETLVSLRLDPEQHAAIAAAAPDTCGFRLDRAGDTQSRRRGGWPPAARPQVSCVAVSCQRTRRHRDWSLLQAPHPH